MNRLVGDAASVDNDAIDECFVKAGHGNGYLVLAGLQVEERVIACGRGTGGADEARGDVFGDDVCSGNAGSAGIGDGPVDLTSGCVLGVRRGSEQGGGEDEQVVTRYFCHEPSL